MLSRCSKHSKLPHIFLAMVYGDLSDEISWDRDQGHKLVEPKKSHTTLGCLKLIICFVSTRGYVYL